MDRYHGVLLNLLAALHLILLSMNLGPLLLANLILQRSYLSGRVLLLHVWIFCVHRGSSICLRPNLRGNLIPMLIWSHRICFLVLSGHGYSESRIHRVVLTWRSKWARQIILLKRLVELLVDVAACWRIPVKLLGGHSCSSVSLSRGICGRVWMLDCQVIL